MLVDGLQGLLAEKQRVQDAHTVPPVEEHGHKSRAEITGATNHQDALRFSGWPLGLHSIKFKEPMFRKATAANSQKQKHPTQKRGPAGKAVSAKQKVVCKHKHDHEERHRAG